MGIHSAAVMRWQSDVKIKLRRLLKVLSEVLTEASHLSCQPVRQDTSMSAVKGASKADGCLNDLMLLQVCMTAMILSDGGRSEVTAY